MKSQRRDRLNKLAKGMIAVILSLCMVAGVAFTDGEVSAASSRYTSPFYSKTYTINSCFNNNVIVNGIDISYWQNKKSNFVKAKKAGVDYAILRVTYTGGISRKQSLNLDSKFKRHYKKAKAAGVMTGVYVFSQAKNISEAKKEADYAVARLKELGIGPEDLELPVYMDYEYYGGIVGRLYGIKRKAATNAAVAFCNRIKSYGYTPGIYASLSFYNKLIEPTALASDVDIWVAQYYSSCGYTSDYSKWQYTSSGKVKGILNLAGFKGSTDVNFWFLNKTPALNPLTQIKGKTKLSVADAKSPKFTITRGSVVLKEGTDYIVGGIRNNAKGSGYAYIKGIGKYGGYALVPITIKAKTSGSASTKLNSKCANYLTYANTEKSTYIGDVSDETITYTKGQYYRLQDDMNLRKGPGVYYSKVKRKNLSSSMKKKTYKGTYAVLKKGKKVKCKKIKGNWMKVPGGWVCCRSDDEIYIR